MDLLDIEAKAKRQGEGGLDVRTIVLDLELLLARPLSPEEAQAVQDGWRASAKVRHAKEAARDLRAAEQLRGRRA